MSGMELASEFVQWVVIGCLAIMVAGLAYANADLNRRLGEDTGPLVPNDGLANDSKAPDIVGTDKRTGRGVQLSDHLGQRTLVAFLAPGCGPCVSLVPHLNRLTASYRDVPILVVLLPGKGADFGQDFDTRINVVDDPSQNIGKAYKAERTPLVYLVNEEGRIAHRTISNDLIDLEDTLKAIGRPQGKSAWVAAEPTEPSEASEPTEPAEPTEPTETSEQ